MKQIEVGIWPMAETIYAGVAAWALATVTHGIEPYLPRVDLFYPYDALVCAAWLIYRIGPLIDGLLRYRRWHRAPVWRVKA